MKVPIVLYDACVLYPAPLRDLLMHLALTELYRAKWIRNVLSDRPDLPKSKLERTRRLMNEKAKSAQNREKAQ